PAAITQDAAAFARWLEALAAWLGVDAEPIETPYGDISAMVRRAGPALLRIEHEGSSRLFVLVKGGRNTVTLLDETRARAGVRADFVARLLAARLEAPAVLEVDALLERARIAPRRREGARRAILRERLAGRRVGNAWILRAHAGSDLLEQAQRAGLGRQIAT